MIDLWLPLIFDFHARLNWFININYENVLWKKNYIYLKSNKMCFKLKSESIFFDTCADGNTFMNISRERTFIWAWEHVWKKLDLKMLSKKSEKNVTKARFTLNIQIYFLCLTYGWQRTARGIVISKESSIRNVRFSVFLYTKIWF